MIITPPSVYIKDTGTTKGRGVFASRNFAVGEIVEVCHVLLYHMPADDIQEEEIRRRVFHWHPPQGESRIQALALGYGSMYNHDNPANMRYDPDKRNLLLIFTAVRHIAADEELTVNYNAGGGDHVSDDDDWFRRMSVEPITGPS